MAPMPKDRARQRIWLSMRVLRQFTTADLVITAQVVIRNAQQYVAGLKTAGYLRELPNTHGRAVHRRYQLIKNTGPNAPRVTEEGVTDTNTWEAFDLQGNQINKEPDHEELA